LGQAGLEKGGPGAALLAFILLIALAAPRAAAAEIPWGAGCTPVAAGATRTSANCGAELVDGRAIAPPSAPAAVRRVIAAANHIRHRPYVWGGGHRGWFTRGTIAPAPSAIPSTPPGCSR
jgi:cell wall-associated NlpC family hydrolase